MCDGDPDPGAGGSLEEVFKMASKTAPLTIESKSRVTALAHNIHELLLDHGDVDESWCALRLATILWESMPFKDNQQRCSNLNGPFPLLVAHSERALAE